jgi:uncharacterized RDD family membrane protein YckC
VAEVVTGEAVVLDVPVARFPSRIGAVLIDLVIQLILLIGGVIAVLQASGSVDPATATALSLTSYVVIVVGYSTAFETLSRGKTPGKMAFGLRVISDDGSPVRFRQALVRALTGAIEIWSFIGAPIGLITSLISARGKRLGDMFAGTYVIQERSPRRRALPAALAVIPPPLLGWAQVAEISRLSDHSAEAAGSYLRRLGELSPAARDDLGRRIATAVAAQVSPPPPLGTPPAAYLAAVLALRREREVAWLASQRAVPGDAAPGPPPGSAPTAPGSGPTAPWTAGPWTGPGQAGESQSGESRPGESRPGEVRNGGSGPAAAPPVPAPPVPAPPTAGQPGGTGFAPPG